jgi:hypothetical protein
MLSPDDSDSSSDYEDQDSSEDEENVRKEKFLLNFVFIL